MTCRLVTLLLVVTVSDLAIPEGVAATTVAKEAPAAPLRLQGNGSQTSGGTMVHVTENAPGDHQPDSHTLHQEHPTSQPALQEHHRSRPSPGGESGGEDSSVDTVLAALVDYSKDPKLWRFVHSVVDELDYSLRASHPPSPATPRRPRPALRLSRPYTHWRRTSAGGKHDTGQSDSHTESWNNGSESHISRNGPGEGTTTTTTTPLLPWLQQPPEEPFIGAHTTQDDNMASDMPSLRGSDRVNFVKSLPAPSTHFFFHKVFLDKTFDNHTRQPYRRPVLALTAREIGAAKSSIDEKGSLPDTANHTTHELNHDGTAEELTDKFDSLSATPKNHGESSQGKDLSQDGDKKYDGDSDVRNVLPNTHHHHHHRHRLHTFKSQLKFLQRWEEKLWRRAHLQPRHHTTGL